jgi:AcrR family transcriptional regulator
VEFAAHGLDGGSTEAIARAVGISQPYVFRLFGTKKELFMATVDRCMLGTLEMMQTAAAGLKGEEALHAIGEAYADRLASDPTYLHSQMQVPRGMLLNVMAMELLGADDGWPDSQPPARGRGGGSHRSSVRRGGLVESIPPGWQDWNLPPGVGLPVLPAGRPRRLREHALAVRPDLGRPLRCEDAAADGLG